MRETLSKFKFNPDLFTGNNHIEYATDYLSFDQEIILIFLSLSRSLSLYIYIYIYSLWDLKKKSLDWRLRLMENLFTPKLFYSTDSIFSQ